MLSLLLRLVSEAGKLNAELVITQTELTMNSEESLRDRTVKLIGIPLLGIIIPNIAGLITNTLYTFTELLLCYAYF
ncbi:MAG TPA: hypothetical protein VGZ71_04790, partial [Puia sp.]|nr:hypothetical protein [Puia sp.]